MKKLKVSIITVSKNSKGTISQTIESVLNQTYPNIEYIIIDGASTDGTIELIENYKEQIHHYISEKDNGIYDAMNKGIKAASGDIVGILNSDDTFYSTDIVEKLVRSFEKENIDAVYGDVQFIDPLTNKVIRYYSSKKFTINKFQYGLMPAHPSFYAKRELFNKFGCYKTDYKIASDFELLLRFLYINKIKIKYVPGPIVSMRKGGISTKNLYSNYLLNKEIKRACAENGLKTNYLKIYSKYIRKIFELFGN